MVYSEQLFNKIGINFILGDPEKGKIIISSHYDGPGIYDNALGAIMIIYLAIYFRDHDNLVFALFDFEEKGCIGAKYFFRKFNNFLLHFDLGGCGVGDVLFAKNPDTPLKLKFKGDVIEIPFLTDASVSSKFNIQSYHLFFLNKEDANNLRNYICPVVFFSLHSINDNLDLIKLRHIYNNFYKIKNLIEENDIDDNFYLKKLFKKHGADIII